MKMNHLDPCIRFLKVREFLYNFSSCDLSLSSKPKVFSHTVLIRSTDILIETLGENMANGLINLFFSFLQPGISDPDILENPKKLEIFELSLYSNSNFLITLGKASSVKVTIHSSKIVEKYLIKIQKTLISASEI